MTSNLTKTRLRTINNNPQNYAETATLEELEAFIKKTNKAYYNTGEPLVTDTNYDIITDIIKKRDPTNKILGQIGAPLRSQVVKVKLPFWMGSMDKVKPQTKELATWLNKYDPPYFISSKLDGLSGMVTYNIPSLNQIKLYTRGDGTTGQDISHLIPFLGLNNKGILDKIKGQEVAFRGEFIMKKSVFQKKYSSDYPKARSLISGNINAKEPKPQIIKDMDFVIYELIYNHSLTGKEKKPIVISIQDQFNAIKKIGFKCVEYKIIKSKLDSDYLVKLLLEMKSSSDYEIDGIIITDSRDNQKNKSGNPKYAVAFKSQLDEQIAITEVVDVEWNPSKRGILVPRIKLKPIKIGGDTITYTTGFNAKYIKDNKIGVGSKLKMIRSGDVIPYIMDVLSPSTNGKPLFPEQRKGKYQWVSSDAGKDSINIELVDKSDSTGVLIKQFANFFSILKIVGVSEGLITRMVDTGFNTISTICSGTQGDFMILPGIKEKSAQNIYEGIHTVIDSPIKLHQLMAASNCFSGLALKKLKIVVDKYPTIMKIADNKLSIGLIEECDGYSTITSKSFINGLSKFKEFLTENPFLKYIDPSKHQPSASTSTTNKEPQNSSSKGSSSSKRKRLFKDVFIVCTGFRDEPMEEQIQEMGATIQSNVNTKTNILVAKDLNVGSSKIKKARELGVTLITYESFKKMIK